MATGDQRASAPSDLTGTGLTLGVVRSRWNQLIVDRLIDGVERAAEDLRVTRTVDADVPGAFEIPFAARLLALSGRVDAVVCVGAVIRGETTHYESVAGECAAGVQHVQLTTGVPVLFGVLTVENEAQALARSEGDGGHNVGYEATEAAVEMARLAQRWQPYMSRHETR